MRKQNPNNGLRWNWKARSRQSSIDNPVVAAALALLIEGEGSISWKRSVRLTIQMTDKEPVTWAAYVMKKKAKVTRTLLSGKKLWSVYVYGKDAQNILSLILPHLISNRKRDAALRAITRTSKRGALGEDSPHHSLIESSIIRIRKLHATGNFSYPKLARMFGTCKQNIYLIVHKKTWRHI